LHSVHVKFCKTCFLLTLIMTHLKCCFIQTCVHPLLRARRCSLCQERTLACNLTGHDRMFLASQRQQIEAVHEATVAVMATGDLLVSNFFLYLGFLWIAIVRYNLLYTLNIPRGQQLLGLAHKRVIDFYIYLIVKNKSFGIKLNKKSLKTFNILSVKTVTHLKMYCIQWKITNNYKFRLKRPD